MLLYELKIVKKLIIFILYTLIITFFSVSHLYAGSFRAGVSKVNITYSNPSVSVHDSLYARTLVLSDGKTKAVIISLDVVNVKDDFVMQVRNSIQKELHIDGSNVLINVSHNHHTQGQLCLDLAGKVVEAVKDADSRLVRVTIGSGTGNESRITMNRRLKLKNGKEWVIRRANPCPPNDEVVSVGEFDPEIGILRINKTDGKPLALLYNFAGHPYGGFPVRSVTAEYPGIASRVIENSLGNGAVALFLQGAAGDVTTILYKDVNIPGPGESFGRMLGLSTLKALGNVQTKGKGNISAISEKILFPHRNDIQERIDSLNAQKEVILNYFKGIGCGSHGAGTSLNFETFLPLYIKYSLNPENPSYYSYRYMQEKEIGSNSLSSLDKENNRNMQKYLQNIYNMEKLIRIMSNLELFEKYHNEKSEKFVSVEVQGMKIGDFVLIGFSGELFSEIGMNIKKMSQYEHTFIAGYSNGSIGYAPTYDAYSGEGYEVVLTKLAPEWQKMFEKKVMEIINKL